jgi:hypothetical protein
MKKKPLKILGHRRQELNPSWEDANRWLHTIAQLRQGKGICPKGVYRFKTFEEADEWMNRMLAKSSLEPRP